MPGIGVGMEDLRLGNVAIIDSRETGPRPAFGTSLRAAANLAKPKTTNRIIELLQPFVVARNRVVLSPATNHTQ